MSLNPALAIKELRKQQGNLQNLQTVNKSNLVAAINEAAQGGGGGGGGSILSNTVQGWNSQPTLISELNTVYVYTNYKSTTDRHGHTVYIPGVKIGDGNAYLIDLPFTDTLMEEHIADTDIHVTPQEKIFWNNKVRVYESTVQQENLTFTTL